MNRKAKRAFKSNDKKLTSIAQRLLIRMLKLHEIDYVRDGDKIISTRNKDVENLYNQATMEVTVNFQRCGNSVSKLKKFYGMK